MRQNWADFDLTTREGVTVEVKASAYLQSWAQRGPSKIKFSGLAARALGPVGTYVGKPCYRAQVYVFCVQTERDPVKYDALAVSRWTFLVVPRAALPVPLQRTIGLERLSRLPGAVPATFGELADAVTRADRQNTNP